MRFVLKSYIPLFIWLAFAAFSLIHTPAKGADDRIEAQVRTARQWMHEGRWRDVARMKLPPAGASAWTSFPDAECELVFVRGQAAARAGYRAMAWHSVERLERMREFAAATGNPAAAEHLEVLRNALRRELD